MTGPSAVVVGLDTITGLQTARILHARGVPVVGLTNDLGHYACRTRACVDVLAADLRSEDVVDALVRLGPELDGRAALFPCTDLAVLLISRHRERLSPWYVIALPDHDVVEMLMDKESFLRHAQERDLPIPTTVIVEDRADAERAAKTLTYPAVLKPPIKSAAWQAFTSAKALPIADEQQLLDVYDRVAPFAPRFIVQEWVEGGADALYSCNAYFDRTGRPLVTFVARKLRQWPPHTGTSSLGEECRNDAVLAETVRLFGDLGYHGLGYLEMKRDARTGRHVIIEPNIGRPTGRSAIAEAGGVELLYTAYCDMVDLPLPAARTQRYVGAKWIDDRRDLQSALYFFRRRQLGVGDWWRSVRGPKWHAVISRSDPQPFLHDLLQASRRGVGMLAARSSRSSQPAADSDETQRLRAQVLSDRQDGSDSAVHRQPLASPLSTTPHRTSGREGREVADDAPFPNFAYIGTSKAGSTWLFNALARHPEVYLASSKGLYYFDSHFDKGRQWYLEQFMNADHHPAVGEISHSYLSSPEAAARIADFNPEMRLLVCLREPVDRAFSDYLDLVKNGQFNGSFPAALERFPRLLDRGRYATHLRRYLERFPREQIHVSFFEDLRHDPQAYADDVFAFLGVRHLELPPADLKSRMPAGTPRSTVLAAGAKSLSKVAKRAGLARLRSRAKRSVLVRQALYRTFRDDRPVLDPGLAADLRRGFIDEVVQLDSMLGREISGLWGYPSPSPATSGG